MQNVKELFRNGLMEEGVEALKNLDRDELREMILNEVQINFVGQAFNRAELEEVPFIMKNDLIGVFVLVLGETEEGTAKLRISNSLVEKCGIEMDELVKAARINTKEKKRFSVMTMNEVMKEITGIEMPATEPATYVITSEDKTNGATAMLYEDVFYQIADEENSDLFILPSSIHELLAIPCNGVEVENLRQMVAEVNNMGVEIAERLSYNVYRYSREQGTICIA